MHFNSKSSWFEEKKFAFERIYHKKPTGGKNAPLSVQKVGHFCPPVGFL